MIYYSKKDFDLYFGDCITELLMLKENSVDMIFADPPYFLSNGSITCQNGKMVSVHKASWDFENNFEKIINFHESWIKECKRVLKPNGTIWISGTYHSIYQCGFILQKLGFKILNDIIWYKKNAPPNLARKCFTASHETLLWAIKDPTANHFFNYDLMKNGDWSDDFLKNSFKQMRSVWSISSAKNKEKQYGKHPTQKPEDLLKRIILSSTKEGDLILDPFNGSGTTGIVATSLKRKYIGIDNMEEYLKITVKRIGG